PRAEVRTMFRIGVIGLVALLAQWGCGDGGASADGQGAQNDLATIAGDLARPLDAGGDASVPLADMAGVGDGSTGFSGSCVMPSMGLYETCEEYQQPTAFGLQLLKTSCTNTKGNTWSDGPCDHHGSIGGCKVTKSYANMPYTTTTWYYAVDGGHGGVTP